MAAWVELVSKLTPKPPHEHGPERYEEHKNWGEEQSEKESIHERVPGIPDVVTSMGLRHESVHAKQESATKDRHAYCRGSGPNRWLQWRPRCWAAAPTMMVSTTPMLIHPISAKIRGKARRKRRAELLSESREGGGMNGETHS